MRGYAMFLGTCALVGAALAEVEPCPSSAPGPAVSKVPSADSPSMEARAASPPSRLDYLVLASLADSPSAWGMSVGHPPRISFNNEGDD